MVISVLGAPARSPEPAKSSSSASPSSTNAARVDAPRRAVARSRSAALEPQDGPGLVGLDLPGVDLHEDRPEPGDHLRRSSGASITRATAMVVGRTCMETNRPSAMDSDVGRHNGGGRRVGVWMTAPIADGRHRAKHQVEHGDRDLPDVAKG